MSLERTEYPAIMAKLQPHDAINVLDSRLRQIGRLNSDIADWLQERRKIEEHYSAALRRLSRNPLVEDVTDLGVFSTPWSNLVEGLDTLAESHHVLARKIGSDIERPIREFQSSSKEHQQLTAAQGELSSIARDIEAAQRKADKLDQKSGGGGGTGGSRAHQTNKMANVTEDLDTARAQWESQAPFVFENLQLLDENRTNHLREILTQFQTHEMDQMERDRKAVERALNTLVQVETADEIKTFALRTLSRKQTAATTAAGSGGSAGPSGAMAAQTPAASNERRQSRSSTGVASSPTVASLTPSARNGTSVSGGPDSPQTDTVPDLPTQKPDKPKGFRRLGTVLGRRRHSKMPAGADRIGELGGSPEKRPDNRRSMLQSSSTFANLTSKMGRSRDNLNLNPPTESASDRPKSPLRTMSSLTDSGAQRQGADSNGDRPPPRREESAPRLPDTIRQQTSATSLQSAVDATHSRASQDHSVPQQQQQQLQTPGLHQTPGPGPGPTQSDNQASEPFSISSRAELDDPISRAQREAAGEATPNQFQVSIRDAPTTQDAGDAHALANVANTLKLQAPMSNPRKPGTVRGRRDMRASVYSPGSMNPFGAPGPLPGELSAGGTTTSEIRPNSSQGAVTLPKSMSQPFLSHTCSIPFSPPAPFEPQQPKTASSATFPSSVHSIPSLPVNVRKSSLVEDAGSIRSGRSLGSTTSMAHKHVDLEEPGLNASVIETVSAWFEDGKVTRGVMIGEVALCYRASNESPPQSGTIRLDNFSRLDKVAPNPAFVSNTAEPNSEAGCYNIDYRQLTNKTQVAFKYQVHLPVETPGLHAPLMITPAWKIDGTTTLAILTCGLNPSFDFQRSGSSSASSLTLKNVTLALYLGEGGARATACQSKPVGVFNKDRNCIYWTIPELVLSNNSSGETSSGDQQQQQQQQPQKFLARFTTEQGAEAKVGKVDAKWELSPAGNGAGGIGSGVQVSVNRSKSMGSSEGGEEDPFSDQDQSAIAPAVGDWQPIAAGNFKLVAGTYTGC